MATPETSRTEPTRASPLKGTWSSKRTARLSRRSPTETRKSLGHSKAAPFCETSSSAQLRPSSCTSAYRGERSVAR